MEKCSNCVYYIILFIILFLLVCITEDESHVL